MIINYGYIYIYIWQKMCNYGSTIRYCYLWIYRLEDTRWRAKLFQWKLSSTQFRIPIVNLFVFPLPLSVRAYGLLCLAMTSSYDVQSPMSSYELQDTREPVRSCLSRGRYQLSSAFVLGDTKAVRLSRPQTLQPLIHSSFWRFLNSSMYSYKRARTWDVPSSDANKCQVNRSIFIEFL